MMVVNELLLFASFISRMNDGNNKIINNRYVFSVLLASRVQIGQFNWKTHGCYRAAAVILVVPNMKMLYQKTRRDAETVVFFF